MKLALEATLSRAIEERHHLILEGVHVVPTELNLEVEKHDAVIIPVMLATLKKELLKRAKEKFYLTIVWLLLQKLQIMEKAGEITIEPQRLGAKIKFWPP